MSFWKYQQKKYNIIALKYLTRPYSYSEILFIQFLKPFE